MGNPSVNGYYVDQAILATTTAFQKITIPFWSTKLIIVNDEIAGGKSISISFSQENDVDIKLLASESIVLDDTKHKELWIKSSSDAASYRLMAF